MNSTLSQTPSRLALGSCNSQNLKQPLWEIIASRRPAAFVFAGDAIYADKLVGTNWSRLPPYPIIEDATPDRLEYLYAKQLSNPNYQKFLSTNITVFGTIDDHDYGSNNGDMRYQYKRESGVAFLKFTNEPDASPVMKRAREGYGVYGVKLFDFARPNGQHLVPDDQAGIDPDIFGEYQDDAEESSFEYSEKSVAVFVLDCRTNKTPWSRGRDAWKPNHNGDFLGERQWLWLESALRRSKASVNIIVNGLQVHSKRFPDGNLSEEWDKFPKAQQRLYDAILESNVKAPILVSGDVHMAQLMRKDCVRASEVATSNGNITLQRPLLELTTSGMTHSWGTCFSPREKFHHGWYSPYYYFASRTVMTFAHLICPWTELVKSSAHPDTFENGGGEGAKTGKQFALDLNFGEMEFDWENQIVIMRVIGKVQGAPPLLSAQWSFDQLSGKQEIPGGTVQVNDFKNVANTMLTNVPGYNTEDHWVCVNFRGIPNPVHVKMGYTAGATLFTTFLIIPYISLLFLFFCPGLGVYKQRKK